MLPDDIRLDHCWVYVSRGIRNGGLKSARLLSQGTLEARTDIAPFPLLGAKAGDAVILIGEQYDQDPVVLRADIDTTGDMNWSNASPSICPTIDIIPDSVAPNEPRASVRVRLNYVDTATPTDLPDQISIFPLGQSLDYEVQLLKGPYHRDWISASQDLPTLDGHVLVRWKDGRQIITPFSQGGDGPNSNQPFPANPMNAGSSDGQALLFMYKEAGDDAPRDIKVVTALAHGLNSMPANWHGCSYAFSIASNQPLPRQFSPTLIMYYDANGVPNQGQDNSGDLRICRWVAAKGWVALPTFVPAGFRFVVAPLNRESGGALIDPAAPHPRVEYYKVCWVPRGA